MAKGERNRRYRKAALLLRQAGDTRPFKTIARQLRRNKNYRP